MSRIAYALSALIRQVETERKNAEYELGDPDGIGVIRSVRFDKSTSKWLRPIIDVARDERVKDVRDYDGQTRVTVVSDIRADTKRPFLLTEVDAVLNDPEDAEDMSYDERRKELQNTPVDDLREEYDFGTDYKKAEIVDAILASEYDED